MKRALTKPSLVSRHQIEDDMEHFKLIELHDNSGPDDCSEPDRALGSWAYLLILVAAMIVGLIWGAVAAFAGSYDQPRIDQEPARPVCTIIFGLPCHDVFRYREPGRDPGQTRSGPPVGDFGPESPDHPGENNGWGNGDQDAPGKSDPKGSENGTKDAPKGHSK